jgi:hypothetical protein
MHATFRTLIYASPPDAARPLPLRFDESER